VGRTDGEHGICTNCNRWPCVGEAGTKWREHEREQSGWNIAQLMYRTDGDVGRELRSVSHEFGTTEPVAVALHNGQQRVEGLRGGGNMRPPRVGLDAEPQGHFAIVRVAVASQILSQEFVLR